ncbi:response regulator [Ligilactobacillus cholophilus]|uniref:response regulator n=1 Tax=Ligilactobacillus cholophilus TaxID=3050131 RepID=UPI0025B02DB2|nr:response regulator [Ligilactobacillus cholophilus]
MIKVFLIEDDEFILNEISQALKKWNYKTEIVSDWQNIDNEIIENDPDLITMDVTLPSFDGFYWTQRIRQVSNIPIIFLTAQNINSEGTRALAVGANDFIEKPFSMDYLIAKINLLVKEKDDLTNSRFVVGDFHLNFLTNTLKLKDNTLHLTTTETIILRILFNSSEKIISRKEIIKQL